MSNAREINARQINTILTLLNVRRPELCVVLKCHFCSRPNQLYIFHQKGTYECRSCKSNGTLDDFIGLLEEDPVPDVDPEVMACYMEEVNKPILKPGSSEKNPSIWTKERMKDNRPVEPWQGF